MRIDDDTYGATHADVAAHEAQVAMTGLPSWIRARGLTVSPPTRPRGGPLERTIRCTEHPAWEVTCAPSAVEHWARRHLEHEHDGKPYPTDIFAAIADDLTRAVRQAQR